MKNSLFVLLLALVTTASASPLKIELPPEIPNFKAAPGVELAMQQCLVCHSSEYITTQPPLSRVAWKASVEKMKGKFGAQISPEQIESLVDYLAKSYGPPTP